MDEWMDGWIDRDKWYRHKDRYKDRCKDIDKWYKYIDTDIIFIGSISLENHNQILALGSGELIPQNVELGLKLGNW